VYLRLFREVVFGVLRSRHADPRGEEGALARRRERIEEKRRAIPVVCPSIRRVGSRSLPGRHASQHAAA